MRETRVRSLGWEDPLEKEMATHSSTLAWRIPWREEPGRLQSMGCKESDMIERLHSLMVTGEPGNTDMPLSFLEIVGNYSQYLHKFQGNSKTV